VTKPRKPNSDRDGATEARILDAAKIVFIRRGTAGARMQEIADEAGVNQALLHYYFRSKERLSEAVFRETAGRLFPAIIQILGSDLPVETKIDHIIDTYLTNMTRMPFLPGYVISELHHHPERIPQLLGAMAGGDLTSAFRPAIEKLDKQLAAEFRAGRMRRITATQLIVNVLALCIFPFAARPMLRAALGLDDEAFGKFIEKRRKELPVFIHGALEP